MRVMQGKLRELVPYAFQGFVILCLGIAWAFSPKAPQLAVVDMNALIAAGSQGLARSGRTSTREVQEWGNRLKEGLEAYGQDRHVVLLARNVVLGGSLPDVTEDVLGFFEAGEK